MKTIARRIDLAAITLCCDRVIDAREREGRLLREKERVKMRERIETRKEKGNTEKEGGDERRKGKRE